MYESGGEMNQIESLADNNTTLNLLSKGDLQTLRESLNDFGNMSGLRCDFNKTVKS